MPDYIFDTTALSNFAAAGRIDLLGKRYGGKAFTTVEVVDELNKGVKAGYSHLGSVVQQIETNNPEGWIHIVVSNSVTEQLLRSQFDQFLGPGEASCLALAISRQMILVTDDLAARRLAEKRKVSLTGTLGILIAMVRQKAFSLEEANAMLIEMIHQNYRSPVDRIDDFI